MTAYIFDIDGTITPSRAKIDPDFAKWFLNFQNSHSVYLVTGSDYPKTLEQVGPEILAASKMVFSCCGNEARIGDEIVYKATWQGDDEFVKILTEELENSKFPLRTGNHIEFRTGLVNFSVVGRGASKDQRNQYIEYDTANNERRDIANRLAIKRPDIEFTIAGETGIDIYPKGKDKSQALDWIKDDTTLFFGDMIVPGGNDWGIAQKCTQSFRVKSWMHTQQLLMEIVEAEINH